MLKSRGHWLAALTCLIVVAIALAVQSRWQKSSERRMVALWRSQVLALDEPHAAAFIASLRQHDRLAIAPLAEAMADSRPLVARAAQDSVANLVADWRLLPADEAVPRLTVLADDLANHHERFTAERQQFSRQLAQQMLTWPLEEADFPTDDLVAQCERILARPLPKLAAVDVGPLLAPMAPNPGPADESLPPIVSAELVKREQRRPLTPHAQQEPAPVLQPPVLSAVEENQNQPLSRDDRADPANEPRPIEPRQFLQPRAPRIPQQPQE